ncbi:unnamed protein product [Adineta ricciae]|uniref:Uncharacterized protein n=1 Tax=Adineta ricciae TaxID=249248 RepID=A0A815MG18_ADIRI|nr:unnamed protein product [Adineta ricciae]
MSTAFSFDIKLNDGTNRTIRMRLCSFIPNYYLLPRTKLILSETTTFAQKKRALNQCCMTNTDCANGNCHILLKTCQTPSCTDGNKNQDELAIDCGGATCLTACSKLQ